MSYLKEERVERIGQLIGEEEADVLLAWAVEGASRLIRQRDFTVPPSSEEALHDWLYSADPVMAWVQACVTVVDPRSPEWCEARVKSSDAHTRFECFAVGQGFRPNLVPALGGFIHRLIANRPTITVKHTNKGNWLTGIKIEGHDPEAMQDSFASVPGGEGA